MRDMDLHKLQDLLVELGLSHEVRDYRKIDPKLLQIRDDETFELQIHEGTVREKWCGHPGGKVVFRFNAEGEFCSVGSFE